MSADVRPPRIALALALLLAAVPRRGAQQAPRDGIAYTGYSCGSLLEPLPGTYRSAESCALDIARSDARVEHFAWGPADSRCWRCDGAQVGQRWPDLFGGHDIFLLSLIHI